VYLEPEVAIGRRNEAHIDRARTIGADRALDRPLVANKAHAPLSYSSKPTPDAIALLMLGEEATRGSRRKSPA